MIVDVIMLSLTNSDSLFEMTQSAINSLHESETEFTFNVLLLESNKQLPYSYTGCTVLFPDLEFNYNRFMNFGLSKSSNELVVLANNDLIFHKNWFSEIYKHIDEADSFSSWNSKDGWHEKFMGDVSAKFVKGYRTCYEMTGWCFVAKRKIFEKFSLDERVAFWFSDNVYADSLQEHGFKHILVRNSFVDHIGDMTGKTLEDETRYKLRQGQRSIYNGGKK